MKYKLGNKIFKNKNEIKIYYQQFLNEEYLHKKIDNNDQIILLEFFSNHIYWNEKKTSVGDNIYIIVKYVNEYNNYCFYLKGDKSIKDISVVKTLKYLGSNKTITELKIQGHKDNVIRALRYEINDQVKEFREKQKCLGFVTYDKHVDHVKFFKYIRDNFLKKENLKYSEIEILDLDDHYELKDTTIKLKWKSFHNEEATYQMLPIKENLKRKPQ